jgi:hypothetical protein
MLAKNENPILRYFSFMNPNKSQKKKNPNKSMRKCIKLISLIVGAILRKVWLFFSYIIKKKK